MLAPAAAADDTWDDNVTDDVRNNDDRVDHQRPSYSLWISQHMDLVLREFGKIILINNCHGYEKNNHVLRCKFSSKKIIVISINITIMHHVPVIFRDIWPHNFAISSLAFPANEAAR
jgi:hypothetical protein